MNVPFRVASTAALSNEHLPAPATFVLVDNTSNQWLYQPDAQRYIAPYAMNISMPLTVANGANMQVAAPPGVTQSVPIAGQQYLATFSDTAPSGYPYTSQTNVEITNGTVDATITGGTVNAEITGGTLDATITNATLNATIASGQVDITNVTPNIEMSVLLNELVVGSGSTTLLGSIPVGSHIRGWSVGSSVDSANVAIYFGPSGSAGFRWWQGPLKANTPFVLVFSPGLSISAGLNENYVWIYTDVAGTLTLTIYYSAT